MNWNEYLEASSRTCPNLGDKKSNLRHMNWGIETEKGELVDIFKRNLAYKKEIDLVNVFEELGDILWYEAGRHRLNFSHDLMWVSMLDKNITNLYNIVDVTINWPNTADTRVLVQLYADHYGWSMEDIMETNIEKLKRRFPDKFTESNAIDRNTDSERDLLANRYKELN